MKRRNNPSDSGMMRYPSSFILGILLFAVHYRGNLLPVAANCSLLPHTTTNIHLRQHHQHLPWRRRRGGAVNCSSRSRISSPSFIPSMRGGGNDGGTRVVEEYDDISEDDSFAIEASDEEFDHRSQADGYVATITPDATIENKSEEEEEVEEKENDADDTINVVKKDGTLQPLDREKVSWLILFIARLIRSSLICFSHFFHPIIISLDITTINAYLQRTRSTFPISTRPCPIHFGRHVSQHYHIGNRHTCLGNCRFEVNAASGLLSTCCTDMCIGQS